MRMKSIASGSSGNVTYVGSDRAHILVDAGVSKKKIEEGLLDLDLSGRDVDALFITHEHADHIGGLGVWLRKYPVPVYATEDTIEAIKQGNGMGKVDWNLFFPIDKETDIYIKDICVQAFSVPHDAADPVAYRFCCDGKTGAIVTDLGEYDEKILSHLRGLDVIYAEANHDVRMLQLGPYPYSLKQRILGNHGHLSNESCGRFLCEVLHDQIKCISLNHLSSHNNLPELAYEAVRLEIEMSETKYRGDDFKIMVAKRSEPSETVEF